MRQLIVFILFAISSNVWSQTDEAKVCFENVTDYLGNMLRTSPPIGSEAYMFDQKTSIFYNSKLKRKPQVSRTKMIRSGNWLEYQSKEFTFYMDEKNSVLINYLTKSISISASRIEVLENTDLDDMYLRIQILFKTIKDMKVSEQKNIEGDLIQYLSLTPVDSMTLKTQVSNIRVDYNRGNKRVEKFILFYTSKSDISKNETLFIEENFRYKLVGRKNALSKIYNSNLEIIEKYKKFEIIND